MAAVSVRGASRHYDREAAVSALDLEIHDGEFLVLVGPSGSGKSTTLRMLAGLEPLDAGSIFLGGEDVSQLDAKDRDVAMVFQSYALYPHMTVAENMGFALKVAGINSEEILKRVHETATLLDLQELLERKPKELSGGEKQRVAMGRAIVRKPQLFLMDEPLSNLDAKLRVSTRTRISALQRELSVTTLYVTHDQAEAMTMGTRVAVMNKGRLHQVASPQEIYEKPADIFVATFIGSPAMNILELSEASLTLHFGVNLNPQMLLGVRPDKWEISESGVEVHVDSVEFLGADSYVYATPKSPDASLVGAEFLVFRCKPKEAPSIGEHLFLSPTEVHLFDKTSGVRLNN